MQRRLPRVKIHQLFISNHTHTHTKQTETAQEKRMRERLAMRKERARRREMEKAEGNTTSEIPILVGPPVRSARATKVEPTNTGVMLPSAGFTRAHSPVLVPSATKPAVQRPKGPRRIRRNRPKALPREEREVTVEILAPPKPNSDEPAPALVVVAAEPKSAGVADPTAVKEEKPQEELSRMDAAKTDDEEVLETQLDQQITEESSVAKTGNLDVTEPPAAAVVIQQQDASSGATLDRKLIANDAIADAPKPQETVVESIASPEPVKEHLKQQEPSTVPIPAPVSASKGKENLPRCLHFD